MMMTLRKARVLVADAEPMARAGLVHHINASPLLEVCAETECGVLAREYCERLKPAVLVLDPTLGDGLALVREMPRWSSETRVVVFTGAADLVSVQRAFKAGAMGYVTRRDPATAVLGAIVGAVRGERHVGPRVEHVMLESLACGGMQCRDSELSVLSERELQIFRLIGSGRATRAMAEELHVSVKTVETHRQRIKEKLGLRNASELQHRAILLVGGPSAAA